MPEAEWTGEDELFMHLVQEHGLGQWQAHGDPVLMHNAAHAFPGVADHTHEPTTTKETPAMTEDLTAIERDTVRCSCGRRWYDRTREEAERIAFEHDDSPFHRHVVSSPLFVGSRATKELS